MKFRPQTWMLLSLLLFLAGGYVWHLADRKQAARKAGASTPPGMKPAPAKMSAGGKPLATSPLVNLVANARTQAARSNLLVAAHAQRLKNRLANTTKTVGQLARTDKAILLENALIDTATGKALPIPQNLRAAGDPGSYIVQARGPVDNAFRASLAAAGATIVSYIPNNAYLVTASAAAAQQLATQAQTVLPYEPYFKLKSDLLALAVDGTPLPAGSVLNILLFPAARDASVEQLQQLGAEILGEDRSPFGPVLKVRTPATALAAVARLGGVHEVELLKPRVPANDLSRVRVGVAIDTLSNTPNYLNLSGSNVLVNVNDIGVDGSHPDLTPRVLFDANTVLNPVFTFDSGAYFPGHGTHVAGIIASSGTNGPPGTNASGSVAGASFRGKAPAANIFAMAMGYSDSYLQETAARTNALISNNSWGNGDSGYDLTAASYDAAVRDALPGVTGSQPVLYVFSAGNNGNGDDTGGGGVADTLHAPATAKNVIAVGAVEQLRNLTNLVQTSVLSTNESEALLSGSDSDSEVAGYSSRGNVGIGIEGEFGRFKPDVVAPGSWVVSTRSAHWDQISYYNPTNYTTDFIPNQVVTSNALNIYNLFVPVNAVEVDIFLSDPDLPLYISQTDFPTTADFVANGQVTLTPSGSPPLTTGAGLNYSVGTTNAQTNSFSITTVIVTTNDNGNYFQVLSNVLNEPLAPYYRYESGTSMAAAAASGTLALMQDFFTNVAQLAASPALMKAMLINGARNVDSGNSSYNFQVNSAINYQGWGMINLPDSLPAALTNAGALAWPAGGSPMVFFDQSPTNALATGQGLTRTIQLSAVAQSQPLRVTLVWTDPPGDPAAGVKLVNDLDLIVTNFDDPANPLVYYGNDITLGRDFNRPWDTNGPANIDFVNNVENVYLKNPLGSNYSITVAGRRVNVNAVTAQTNNVVQDYALVISSGDGAVTNAITITDAGAIVNTAALPPNSTNIISDYPLVTAMPNSFSNSASSGGILLGQHVGANAPLLDTNTFGLNGTNEVITTGLTNQWHFYLYTNNTTFTNVAFATFLPPTLAIPREGVFQTDLANATRPEADIDLYVSTNPGLTNLDTNVLSSAANNQGGDRSSLGRGGTETIVYSNASSTYGQIYYIGVKSEDRQAAEYGFVSVSSLLPFDQNQNGVHVLNCFPSPAVIPDGTPANPGAALVFGIGTGSEKVRRAVVTNEITHELMGDLLGNLSYNGQFAVLNNHTGGNGRQHQVLIYDDSGEGDIAGSRPSDGPGSLKSFVGQPGAGLWLFTMVDNSPGNTGQVDNLTIHLDPQPDTNSVTVTLLPGGSINESVDVPPTATNLTVSVSGNTDPVLLFLKRGSPPTQTDFDVQMTVNPPGGQITLTRSGIPPLLTGTYYILVYNPPGNTAQTITLTWNVGLDLKGVLPAYFDSKSITPLLDDAVTDATITVDDTNIITSVEVGVRMDHPRESDLALTLVSPGGTRVLLAEDRGGTDTNGYGISGSIITNVLPQTYTGTNQDTRNIFTGATAGTLFFNFSTFNGVPSSFNVKNNGFVVTNAGPLTGINLLYTVNYGPGIDPNLIITVNPGGNSDTNAAWSYTATVIQNPYSYATFTEDTNKTITPIKFAPPPFHGAFGAGVVMFSGFEGVPVGDYQSLTNLPPANIDGWTVISPTTNDFVTVNSKPTTAAHGGTNYAQFELGNGGIYRLLPTVPGRNYNLNFFWAAGTTNAAFQVGLAGVYTNTLGFNGTPYWNYETRTFTATTAGTLLVIQGLQPLIRLDDFTLTELPSPSYYLPEESLAVLKGEPAGGEWTLEAWDNRAGATNPGPALVSWNLSFIYNDTAPASAFSSGTNPPAFLDTNINGATFTVDEMTLFVLTNSATDPDPGTTLSYTLLNSTSGASISPVGVITWIPTEAQGPGVYTITTVVTDNSVPSLSATNSFTVVVNEVNRPPVFVVPNPPNLTTSNLATVIVTNAATDPDIPPNPLAYTLLTDAVGAGIDTNGVITWTPQFALSPSTNFFTTIVTDTNAYALTNNSLSATNTFYVTNLFAPASIITLTNGIPFPSANSGAGIATDFYRYVVTNSPPGRAQFEINNPGGDMTLVARKGSPLPTLANLTASDYISANPYTNDELIVVLTNSAPVALADGDWFLSAVNISGGPVAYSIKATEWPASDLVVGLVITNVFLGTNDFCLTWTSLPGVHYHVQGKINLAATNWTDVSPTITATTNLTGWCVPLPSPFHFFRVAEGLAINPYFPPVVLRVASVTANAVTLVWNAPVTARFNVQWAALLPPAWNSFTNVVTSTTGLFTFTDDGSQTGGLNTPRFYRLMLLP